jgi:HEAT repeat protein
MVRDRRIPLLGGFMHGTVTTIAAALLLALAAPVGAQQSAPEPTYEGRTLSTWTVQLTDIAPMQRSRAAYVLAELGAAAAPAVPALRRALADEDAAVRYAAIWALSEIGPEASTAIPELRDRADEDAVGDVRWIAAKALRKLGVRDARPAPE